MSRDHEMPLAAWSGYAMNNLARRKAGEGCGKDAMRFALCAMPPERTVP